MFQVIPLLGRGFRGKSGLIFFEDKGRKFNKRATMALGHSPEYHWNQIISKSVNQFSSRSRLKLFSIYSPGGHFVQQSRMVWAIFVDSHLRKIPIIISKLFQNQCTG